MDLMRQARDAFGGRSRKAFWLYPVFKDGTPLFKVIDIKHGLVQ